MLQCILSHRLPTPNQSALAEKQAAMAGLALPFPCPAGSSPSDSSQWLAQRHWDDNNASYPPDRTPAFIPTLTLHPMSLRGGCRRLPSLLGRCSTEWRGEESRYGSLQGPRGQEIQEKRDKSVLRRQASEERHGKPGEGRGLRERQILEHYRKKDNFFPFGESSSEPKQWPARHLVPHGWAGDLGAFSCVALPTQIHQQSTEEPSQWCQAPGMANYCCFRWFTAQQQHNPWPGPRGGDHPHLPAGRMHLCIHRQPEERQRGLPSTFHRPLRGCRPLGGGECPGRRTGLPKIPSCVWSQRELHWESQHRTYWGAFSMMLGGSAPLCKRGSIRGRFGPCF